MRRTPSRMDKRPISDSAGAEFLHCLNKRDVKQEHHKLQESTCECKDRTVWTQSRQDIGHEATPRKDEDRRCTQLIGHHNRSCTELLSNALIFCCSDVWQLNNPKLLFPATKGSGNVRTNKRRTDRHHSSICVEMEVSTSTALSQYIPTADSLQSINASACCRMTSATSAAFDGRQYRVLYR